MKLELSRSDVMVILDVLQWEAEDSCADPRHSEMARRAKEKILKQLEVKKN